MADLNVCEFGHPWHRSIRRNGWQIWEWRHYQGLAGYCPAQDDVSKSIDLNGDWEREETAVALSVVRPGDLVVDFGSHIGWYTTHAARAGATVLAYDSDPENMRLLERNARPRGHEAPRVVSHLGWLVDAPALDALPIRLVKADVEGAEDQALRIIRRSLDAGLVDYLLIECSPEFADYYPALIDDLTARGYTAEIVGKGGSEPVTGATLGPVQRNVWFSRA